MSSKGAISLLLLILVLEGSKASTKYIRADPSQLFKTKNLDNLRVLYNPNTRHSLYDETAPKPEFLSQINRRSSYVETSTFNPDVLNKFLEEYANKIKISTEHNFKLHPYSEPTEPGLTLGNDDDYAFATTDEEVKSTETSIKPTIDENENASNDTYQRNKYWTANPQDDRNGWVTLDAIPWSKSKISKWQANPSTQNPWPDMKPWDTPNSVKPWQTDYPPSYETNKPWQNRPKPNWAESQQHSRPSYSHEPAQKWPPERPSSWDKNPNRPDTDIITDNRPSNFPNNWDRIQMTKPSFPWNKFSDKNNDFKDWNHPPSPTSYPGYSQPNRRPPFANYQYEGGHPSNHPVNGDGQWVLLSTNRGYSKSRQRSIKINALNGDALNVTVAKATKEDNPDPAIPVLTSKRQVRLTVLPSINGTNTTTSHGGLLEVERTFETVDQSQKAYERRKMSAIPTIIKKKPFPTTVIGQPSSSAMLAAVGAGMLPATMAMMIPMMLGRRKRSISLLPIGYDSSMSNKKYSKSFLRLMRNYRNQRHKLHIK